MEIAVCIKQVPGTSKVDIDEETGVLKRAGVDSKLNPYDLYALEAAFKLRESQGGKVTVVSMGPPQSGSIIKEAYAMGADRGFLFSDKAFAGADVLATSYVLAQGIELAGHFDIIICGKQTTDGDTAQVGPEIAERMDIPHATNVTEIMEVGDRTIKVTVDMGDWLENLEIELPCLITVDKNIYEPRLPSYKRGIETKDREIAILTLKDFTDSDSAHYGLEGSPTRVERVYAPEGNVPRETYEGETAADELYQRLVLMKII